MHDIDRTQAEIWGELETNGYEVDEFEFESEFDGEGVFDEADEMELAAELLEITDEAELEEFLGKLIKSAGRAIGKAVKSPVGRAIGGMLKGVAKKALPMVGGALGNLVLPGVGGAMGSQLASAAGSMFGLELEGMSAEDQEFEVARRIVRLGGESVRQASSMPQTGSPTDTARKAVTVAAQQHAPGLVAGKQNGQQGARQNGQQAGRQGGQQGGRQGGRQRGVWMRRGNKVVLYGL